MTPEIIYYLGGHAFITIGAVIVFLVRTEHRMTKTETILTLLKEDHDRYVDHYHKTMV